MYPRTEKTTNPAMKEVTELMQLVRMASLQEDRWDLRLRMLKRRWWWMRLTCTRCCGTCCKKRRPEELRIRGRVRRRLEWLRRPKPTHTHTSIHIYIYIHYTHIHLANTTCPLVSFVFSYWGLRDAVEVRAEVVLDPFTRSRQRDPSQEQDEQHEVWEQRCEPHHLPWCRDPFPQGEVADDVDCQETRCHVALHSTQVVESFAVLQLQNVPSD